ncbi:MAG: molybdate ABC transporter substrate-binding protein [Leptonema sp. (in: bacteria)]
MIKRIVFKNSFKPKLSIKFIVILFFLINFVSEAKEKRLLIFTGAASKPPTEEVIQKFEKKTGIKVDATYGGSGYLLSQMILTKKGDIYFPGSSDYMELAKKKDVVFHDTEKIVVYLVPAINVQRGNPKKIKSLKDLTKPGIKIVIANPEGVCVGSYAVEIIEKNLNSKEKEEFRKNLIGYAESCEKTASVISFKAADAVIGWRVFEYWDPERIETIPLNPKEISRISYIPIAISKFTKDRESAQLFIDFVLSEEGKAIFKKYNYFKSPDDAFAWIGSKKPIGGEYIIPKEWITKSN